MEFVFNNSVIKVQTIISKSSETNADIVISDEKDFDRKTFINIKEKNSETTIIVHWSYFDENFEPSLYWREDTRILYIGAVYVSAVIDVGSKKLIDINYPNLFWGWECVNNNVLELGELDCRLYSKSGNLIGHARVDPPYDYQITDEAVLFSSTVMGKTSIELK